MSDSNHQSNFIDKVGKTAIFGFFGLLLIGVIIFPIIFSLMKTGAISEETIPFITVDSAPDELNAIIEAKQIQHVKESYGEADFECFTASDLEQFKNSNTVRKIRNELRKDPHFKSIVEASRLMSESNFVEMIEQARKVRRPTWTELGKVSGKGQTDAGSKAEVLIADGIVDLFLELRNR